jgi:hypothetical protein
MQETQDCSAFGLVYTVDKLSYAIFADSLLASNSSTTKSRVVGVCADVTALCGPIVRENVESLCISKAGCRENFT